MPSCFLPPQKINSMLAPSIVHCNCYVDSSWSPPNYRINFIFPPLVPLSNSRRIYQKNCILEKALIQLQRLTYVEAPPSTNGSGAFPYEPAAAYIRSRGAGGAQSTLDLRDLGAGGPWGTQRWALGAIGANEGWKQPFPILEQKEEKKQGKKIRKKLRSREKKEWKLVKTMFFLNFVTQWEPGQKKKRNQKKRKPRTSQCNDCRYICT